MDYKPYKYANNFIVEFKKEFPKVNFTISEVEYDKSILILHNYKEHQNDDKFMTLAIDLLEKYFYSNGIINWGFNYDYSLDYD